MFRNELMSPFALLRPPLTNRYAALDAPGHRFQMTWVEALEGSAPQQCIDGLGLSSLEAGQFVRQTAAWIMERPLRAVPNHINRVIARLESLVHDFRCDFKLLRLKIVDGRRRKRRALIEPQRCADFDGLTELAHDFSIELLQSGILKRAAQWIDGLLFSGRRHIRREGDRQDHHKKEHGFADSYHVDPALTVSRPSSDRPASDGGLA